MAIVPNNRYIMANYNQCSEYVLSMFVRTLTLYKSRFLVGPSTIIMSGVLSETIRQQNDSRIFSPPLRTEHGFPMMFL